MNKDKIIKDLKEKNRKLKNQYELQEIRLYSSQHKVDELEKQIENQAEIIRKQSEKIIPENLDLHNRINKAIDILDNSSHYLKICIDNDLTPMQLASMIFKNEIEVDEIKGSEE